MHLLNKFKIIPGGIKIMPKSKGQQGVNVSRLFCSEAFSHQTPDPILLYVKDNRSGSWEVRPPHPTASSTGSWSAQSCEPMCAHSAVHIARTPPPFSAFKFSRGWSEPSRKGALCIVPCGDSLIQLKISLCFTLCVPQMCGF